MSLLDPAPPSPPNAPPNSFSLKSPQEKPPLSKEPIQATALKDLDLPQELAMQYATAKQLYEQVQHETETPANQKAQILNAISSILTNIVKTQEAVYSVERLKILEDTLIATLKGFPDVRNQFIDAYEAALKKAEK